MEQNGETKSQDEPPKLVIVTGFGPFVGHEDVNASWEAVRLLPDSFEVEGTKYVLQKQEIPVEYEAVDKAVKDLWERKPVLVIHCGVHGAAECVHIEKLAYNHKFRRADYAGKHLPKGSACLVNCKSTRKFIRCRLNVDEIVAAIAEDCNCTPKTEVESVNKAVAKVSSNVGDYLCGYIYLKSLDMNDSRTLFVHVPQIDKPFSSEHTSKVILKIIQECIHQIDVKVH